MREALIRLNPEIAAQLDRTDEVLYRLLAILMTVRTEGLVKANKEYRNVGVTSQGKAKHVTYRPVFHGISATMCTHLPPCLEFFRRLWSGDFVRS